MIADEPHSYPSSDLYDVVAEGSIHRDEPLTILISTAGYNRQGFFYRKLQYFKDVANGIYKNNDIYLMDFSLDDDDDWTNEDNWIKCNPALGFGVKLANLQSKFKKALHSATEEMSFKTKHLNMWVDSAVNWIKNEDWKRSNGKRKLSKSVLSSLVGKECYGGLDLSSVSDLTAWVLVFPDYDGNGNYAIIPRFFIPKDTARERTKTDKVPYMDWIKEGLMIATAGNRIDYNAIYDTIVADAELYDIRELAFDRWNSSSLVTKLMDEGIECLGFGQGFQSMTPAINSIDALVQQEQIHHFNNPILAWNVANVLIVQDHAENKKFDKEKAVERIDGAVALAMSINRAEVYRDEMPEIDSLVG